MGKKRKCLRCGDTFTSASSGNRICTGCKNGKSNGKPTLKEIRRKITNSVKKNKAGAPRWKGQSFSDIDKDMS